MARMTGATGVQTNRSDYQLPAEVSNEIIQKSQESSAVMRLARRITIPAGGAEIPVILGDPQAEWVAETEAKPVSNPEISKKIVRAYKMAVIVPFSNEFRRDLKSLYDALIDRLPNALGAKFDETVFHGTAPGTNFDVLANCTAQSISSDPYTALVASLTDIATHDGEMNGIVISPAAKGILLGAKDGNERPLFINSISEAGIPRILGVRTEDSRGVYKAGSGSGASAVPAVVGFTGDWTKAMVGVVENVKIDISEEATLVVGSGASASTINLWQQNMFAVKAEMELGFAADTTVFNKLTA